MERADSADTTFGILAISVAECFGSESVSPEATVRCGSGLFVTDDLLRPGYSMVSLVSLKYSLAGLAMKQGRPLTVRLPSGSSSFGAAAPTRIVACAPISIPPPQGANYAPLQVGALLVGSPGDLSVNLKAGLSRLAGMAGPALLTIGLSRVQHLSHLLSLRDADAEYIGLEEDLQDLPIEVARPQQSEFGPPTQPLDLGSGVHSEELEAVAAAAAIAAAAVVNGGDKKANVLYNVDEGVEEEEEKEDKVLNNGKMKTTAAATTTNGRELNGASENSQFFLVKGATNGMDSYDDAPIMKKGEGSAQKATINSSINGEEEEAFLTKKSHQEVSLGALLSYQNSPSMESAYIATEARVYAASDAAFCLLYIITVVCCAWASSAQLSQPPSWMAFILAGTAVLPLIASLTALLGTSTSSDAFYARYREPLLMMLMLVPIVVSRWGGRGSSSDGALLLETQESTSPCLLQRSADLTMAVFMPLGCRIRFCWLLPAQMLNIVSILVAVPWLQVQSGVTCAAALGCAGALPLVLTYRCEAKARQRVAALLNTTTLTATPATVQ